MSGTRVLSSRRTLVSVGTRSYRLPRAQSTRRQNEVQMYCHTGHSEESKERLAPGRRVAFERALNLMLTVEDRQMHRSGKKAAGEKRRLDSQRHLARK